eukprot:525185-Pyramimonas_sp.AAC.1
MLPGQARAIERGIGDGVFSSKGPALQFCDRALLSHLARGEYLKPPVVQPPSAGHIESAMSQQPCRGVVGSGML